MFKIIGRTIHLTRGDACSLKVKIKDSSGEDYTFEVGDVLRLNVFVKKDCDDVVLTKTVIVSGETTDVTISLEHSDTKIGNIINKPVTYWYEIVLNPDTNPQTVIGYDVNGSADFILYPEGKEL